MPQVPPPDKTPEEHLGELRDVGAVTYLSAYIRLMGRSLNVPEPTKLDIGRMVLSMVEPMNHATEAIWRALMKDDIGKEEAIERFRESLRNI